MGRQRVEERVAERVSGARGSHGARTVAMAHVWRRGERWLSILQYEVFSTPGDVFAYCITIIAEI